MPFGFIFCIKNNMGLNSDNNKLQYSSIAHNHGNNVFPLGNSHINNNASRTNGRMATLIKILYSSWLSNTIGATLFGYWLIIDFNDIKMMVLGVMSMIWATGIGLISLWRLFIKAKRESFDLDHHIKTIKDTATQEKSEKQLRVEKK